MVARMTRFYFDVRADAQHWSEDGEGTLLRGPDEARREAVGLALAMAGQRPPGRSLEVRVRSRDVVALVRLSLEVELPAEPAGLVR